MQAGTSTPPTVGARRPGGLRTWEAEGEVLPKDPPPALVRMIIWLLLLIFFAALLAAVVVRVPETVRSPFILVSEKGADPIQSPLLAVVQKVQVSEGEVVAAGALLFVLRSDEIRGWQTQWRTGQEDLRALEERSRRLEEAHTSQVTIKSAELAQVEQQLEFRQKHAEVSRDYVRRMGALSKDGLISEVELIKYQLQLAESEKELNVTERTRQQVMLDRQRMDTERARQRGEEQAEQTKLRVRLEALTRQLENCEGDLLYVRAPYRAVVISVAQRNAGNVLPTGGQLCELSPLEGRPRARLWLSEEALGQVSPRQPVRLFFNAFPYQRHGAVPGQVEWVSPAAVSTPAGAQFVALASLEQTSLLAHGMPRPLQPGMKGEARIRVGARTLIEYAFEPIRGLRENLGR